MWIIGIDFSSFFIDLVFIHLDDEKPPRWDRFQLEGQDAFDRTRTVGAMMPRRGSIYWADVVAVGIEHPAGPSTTVLAPMRVQGAVLSMIPTRVLVQPWPPSAWRKAVGLSGKASKDDVASFVFDVEPLTATWKQDGLDAYCIAIATRAALEHTAA